jgi:hypothetical protein
MQEEYTVDVGGLLGREGGGEARLHAAGRGVFADHDEGDWGEGH